MNTRSFSRPGRYCMETNTKKSVDTTPILWYNFTVLKKGEKLMARIEKVFELLNYLVLMMLIVGQCTVGSNFLIGQSVYLGANLISVSRCFILKRPIADKVKDCSCLAITCGLLSIKLLGGIIS